MIKNLLGSHFPQPQKKKLSPMRVSKRTDCAGRISHGDVTQSAPPPEAPDLINFLRSFESARKEVFSLLNKKCLRHCKDWLYR
jgi:hypothetical protein